MSERVELILYFRTNGFKKSITTDSQQLKYFESMFIMSRGGGVVPLVPVFKFTRVDEPGHARNYTTINVGVVDLREVAYYTYQLTELRQGGIEE